MTNKASAGAGAGASREQNITVDPVFLPGEEDIASTAPAPISNLLWLSVMGHELFRVPASMWHYQLLEAPTHPNNSVPPWAPRGVLGSLEYLHYCTVQPQPSSHWHQRLTLVWPQIGKG